VEAEFRYQDGQVTTVRTNMPFYTLAWEEGET
jgi:hypothetical protein